MKGIRRKLRPTAINLARSKLLVWFLEQQKGLGTA